LEYDRQQRGQNTDSSRKARLGVIGPCLEEWHILRNGCQVGEERDADKRNGVKEANDGQDYGAEHGSPRALRIAFGEVVPDNVYFE
jgi:hypothetical protein